MIWNKQLRTTRKCLHSLQNRQANRVIVQARDCRGGRSGVLGGRMQSVGDWSVIHGTTWRDQNSSTLLLAMLTHTSTSGPPGQMYFLCLSTVIERTAPMLRMTGYEQTSLRHNPVYDVTTCDETPFTQSPIQCNSSVFKVWPADRYYDISNFRLICNVFAIRSSLPSFYSEWCIRK